MTLGRALTGRQSLSFGDQS
ncbi:MAG: hypothetical protein ACHQT9_04680 [Candidatus Saccharimonadales bacterium]